MKACKECKGDGFRHIDAATLHPSANVWGAQLVYDRGGAYYQFKCNKCSGRGIIEWTRGKPLTPLIQKGR